MNDKFVGHITYMCGSIVVHRFDSHHEFCDAQHMKSITRNLIATLLIMWFPLFAGNALAASITMQGLSGDCSEARMLAPDDHHAHVTGSMTHGMQAKYISQCDQLGKLAHMGCGVCLFSCAGHITVASIEVAAIVFPSSSFAPVPVRFQSASYSPLLPPPLARV